MAVIRRQATLFVNGDDRIASVRRKFNPVQANLIGPHVTLIREDEVENWSAIANRIARTRPLKFPMTFSRPMRDGDFVWCQGSADDFDQLRSLLLGSPRKHSPHLTLIHPRNGACDDGAFSEIRAVIVPFVHEFEAISFIEQADGGPWRILDEFPLQ